MHAVVETEAYAAAAKNAGLTEAERHKICVYLSENPQAGDLIKGAGGARKVRFPGRSKGKSGGYRVVTYYADRDVPVFLLSVYAKGERINLTQAERNEVKGILKTLADDYRRSQKVKVARLKTGSS